MKNIFEEWRILDEQISNENTVNGKSILFDTKFDFFIKKDLMNNLSITILCNEKIDDEIDIDLFGIKVNIGIDQDIDSTKQSIIIKNTNKNRNDIFIAFSTSLYENIMSDKDREIVNIIRKTINEYIEYFKGSKNQLSEMEQQGLFGELSYMLEHVEQNNEIVKNWEGVFKNKHDYVFKDYSVEIKTTRNQTQLDIHISNENQLDNIYVNKLDLVVYRIEKVNVGQTIYDLYLDIVTSLESKYVDEFKAKIIKSGLNVNNVDSLLKFRLVERYEFDVDDEFPKITKSNLMKEVHDVKYNVVIDGLERSCYRYENK